jgi:hypothetical protein
VLAVSPTTLHIRYVCPRPGTERLISKTLRNRFGMLAVCKAKCCGACQPDPFRSQGVIRLQPRRAPPSQCFHSLASHGAGKPPKRTTLEGPLPNRGFFFLNVAAASLTSRRRQPQRRQLRRRRPRRRQPRRRQLRRRQLRRRKPRRRQLRRMQTCELLPRFVFAGPPEALQVATVLSAPGLSTMCQRLCCGLSG